MKEKSYTALAFAVVIQLLVLVGSYVNASMPLWVAPEIRVKTLPVDPRSMFRGNYARLEYEFSQLEKDLFSSDERLRKGEVIYVLLEPDADGVHNFSNVSLLKPKSGVFIRGRVVDLHYREEQEIYALKFGIEAFFAPEEKAIALEKVLREKAIAVLAISENGYARVKRIVSSAES